MFRLSGEVRDAVGIVLEVVEFLLWPLAEAGVPEMFLLRHQPRLEHLGLGRSAVAVEVAGLGIAAGPAAAGRSSAAEGCSS